MEILLKFNSEQWRQYAESIKWQNKPKCPCCQSQKYYALKGMWAKSHHYKCANCYKKYSVFTGTVFNNKKISMSCYFMIICDLCGFTNRSTCSYATEGLMTQKTAWCIKADLIKYKNVEIDDPVQQLEYLIKLVIGNYQYPFIIQHTQQLINKLNKQTNGPEYSRFAQTAF